MLENYPKTDFETKTDIIKVTVIHLQAEQEK